MVYDKFVKYLLYKCFVLMKPTLIVVFSINSQLKIDGYIFPPNWRDRDSYGGVKMDFVRESFITKRLENLEAKLSETICLELTVSN